MPSYLLGLTGIAGAAILGTALRRTHLRRRQRARLFDTPRVADAGAEVREGRLARWLGRAGFHGSGAVSLFLGTMVLALLLGSLVPWSLRVSGIHRELQRGLAFLPGAIGDVFLPVLYVLPWGLGSTLMGVPWLIVRAARQRRVQAVEQDLPIYLELFATLSEAGLGFDAALDRILRAQPAQHPLAQEFRTFQVELLAGRRRTECLRRLGRRLDVLTLTMFVSAMIQAEQVGSGVAGVLRRQADDLRERRRERLLAQALTLPVKMVFPLVLCFLPGIFVVTLGPIFYQFFQLVEGLVRGGPL